MYNDVDTRHNLPLVHRRQPQPQTDYIKPFHNLQLETFPYLLYINCTCKGTRNTAAMYFVHYTYVHIQDHTAIIRHTWKLVV